jgi:hypothetical protein
VWLAGEFSATSAHLHDWGTEIGNLWSEAPADVRSPRLSRVHDAPDPFSPNRDGVKDRVRIYWHVSEGSVVTDKISRKGGGVVAVFDGYVTKGSWYDVWNGRSNNVPGRAASGREAAGGDRGWGDVTVMCEQCGRILYPSEFTQSGEVLQLDELGVLKCPKGRLWHEPIDEFSQMVREVAADEVIRGMPGGSA